MGKFQKVTTDKEISTYTSQSTRYKVRALSRRLSRALLNHFEQNNTPEIDQCILAGFADISGRERTQVREKLAALTKLAEWRKLAKDEQGRPPTETYKKIIERVVVKEKSTGVADDLGIVFDLPGGVTTGDKGKLN